MLTSHATEQFSTLFGQHGWNYPLFTQSGELTTKMTTKNRSTHRLHVTGVCCEFMPTDYRRSYVEGKKGLRAQSQVLCLILFFILSIPLC